MSPSKTFRILVAILFGLLGFWINNLNWQLALFPGLKINILAGLLFPLTITLAWGWRYGLLSALAGGCQSMWWLFSHYGWGLVYTVPVYSIWIIWHGIMADWRKKGYSWYKSSFILEIPFRIFAELGFYTVFLWLVSFNPPPWNPDVAMSRFTWHQMHILTTFHALTAYFLLIVAQILLGLRALRLFFDLSRHRPEPNSAKASPMDKTDSGLLTLIGQNSRFEGVYKGKENIFIQGELSGELNCEQEVYINQDAVVQANVRARKIIVHGRVAGDVSVKEDSLIGSGGNIDGDLKTSNLTVETGGRLNGMCQMSDADSEENKRKSKLLCKSSF